MDSDNRPGGTGRRVGRDALLDAASDLFTGVDLATLVGSVVGVRAVAEAAEVSPATVNHHFRPGGGGPNHRLAAAALDRAIQRGSSSGPRLVAEASLTTTEALRQGDPDALARLAGIAATDVLWFSPDGGPLDRQREAQTVATFLGAAVAPRSPEARRSLESHYREITAIYSALYEALLEATGRRLIADLDLEAFANILTALADGFILRRRFEPAAAPAPLFGDTVVRLFEALTSPSGSAEDHHPADRLLPLPPGSGLDAHRRAAIVRAAVAVYQREGWEGVTIGAVEQEAGVSRRTVMANLGDRNGLAAAIWSQLLPDLRVALAADAELSAHRRIARHLQRITELVRAHHQLTGALIAGMLAYTIEHGPPTGADPDDPRTLVPLAAMLRPVLVDCALVFRPGLADDRVQAMDSAVLLTNTTLHLAISQPSLPASEVTARVCDTMLAGMLARRPARW